MKRTFALTLGVAASLIAGACVAHAAASKGLVVAAADTSYSSYTDTSNMALVGGTPFLRVRTTWAGLSPQERAERVQARVNEALSVGPVVPSDISVGKVQGDWCVLFRGRRFYTADAATARMEGVSAKKLAEEWASDAREKLVDMTKSNP